MTLWRDLYSCVYHNCIAAKMRSKIAILRMHLNLARHVRPVPCKCACVCIICVVFLCCTAVVSAAFDVSSAEARSRPKQSGQVVANGANCCPKYQLEEREKEKRSTPAGKVERALHHSLLGVRVCAVNRDPSLWYRRISSFPTHRSVDAPPSRVPQR